MTDDPRQSRERMRSLLRVTLLVFGGQVLILFVVHSLFARGTPPHGFCHFHDYGFFHHAAQFWLSGRDPYTVCGFVTPPPSLIVPSLLAHLPESRATLVFFWCNLILVPLSLWWYAGELGIAWRERLLLLACAALFASTQECVRGGNMDGLMFTLLAAAFSVRRRLTGALALAASVVIKVYSIILFPVALRMRQWKFAALTASAGVALLLPFHSLQRSAVHALIGRNGRFLYYASISPVSLIFSQTGEYSLRGKLLYLLFWMLTFFTALCRDQDRELSPRTLARYVPWMLALPFLVFSYVGVLALAVLASLMATAGSRPLQRAEYYSFIGFLLLGIHVEQAAIPMHSSFDSYHYAALVQSAGVCLMMIGACLSPSEIPSKAPSEIPSKAPSERELATQSERANPYPNAFGSAPDHAS